MKKNLLIVSSDLFNKFQQKPLRFLFFLILVFVFGITTKTTAQCIGPYQHFESFRPTASRPTMILATGSGGDGWTLSSGSVTPANAAVNSRSGINYLQFGTTPGNNAITPLLVDPQTLSFYIKDINANLTSGVDNGCNYTIDACSLVSFASGVIPLLTGTTAAGTAFTPVSIDLSSYSNIYVRITLTSQTTTTNAVMALDDLAWTSRTVANNVKVVPELGTSTCGPATPVMVPSAASGNTLSFYDHGGVNDNYSKSQTHTLYFAPTTAGEKVQFIFNSFNVDSTTKITVYNGNGTTPTTEFAGLNNVNAVTAGTTVTSTDVSGYITITFTSTLTAPAVANTGFDITVKCPLPPTISSLSAASGCDGTSFTITGTNLSSATSVTVGGVAATINANTSTSITVTPANGSSGVVVVTTGVGSSSGGPSYTSNPLPTAVTVSTSGTYCNSTTLTAANGGSGTIYWQNTTSGGISTATASTSQLVSSSGTYYFRAQSAGCWGTEGSATVTITTVPTAPGPTAGTAATSSSITANWNASPGATGYVLEVATDNLFASMVSGSPFSVGNVLTYPVTGLASGTTYYYRVKAINACGTGSSFGVISYATLSLSYCTPAAPATTTTFVNNFSTTGGITNISNLATGFTAGGYANYTAQSCSQYPASSVNYSITSVRTDSTDQTFFYYIWVDWNNDGDFTDTGETQLATTTYQAGPFTGSFAVPAGQAAGSYRMRVSTSWIGANTSCTYAAGGRGEFEDYTFTVVPVPPCATSTPSALTSSSISGTTAVISWTDAAMTPNSIYNYYYSTTNTAPLVGTTPSGTVTGTNSASLTGLTLGVTYYFWVRSNCGTPAAWIGSANFTTVNVDIINMTNGSMTTCNAKFYDSGGSVGNYSNSETYTYTIYPSAGSKLKVVFNSFATETNWDGLMIYDGNSTAATVISSGLGTGSAASAPAGSWRGSLSPGTIVSTAADGSLTFKWTSDGSVTFSGWDADVTCVTVPVITSFTPTSTCSGTYPLVTLTGSNFTGVTSVKFNGTAAVFTVVSPTSITATVPVGASTGYISVANAQATGYSATFFTVNPTPAVPSAGTGTAICNGASTTLTGSSTGVTNTVLNETFNAGPFPTGWSRTLNGGFSPGDFRTSSEFVSGGNTWAGNGYTGFCSYFYSYLIAGSISGDMITSSMDLSSYTASSLTFWIYNSSGTDALNVYANNNGGAYTLLGTYGVYGSWTQITVNLGAFIGTGFNTVRLKFTGTSDGGSSNIGIDDITVTGTITASYLWAATPSGTITGGTTLTPSVTPTTDTNYTLTTSFPSGCSATSSPITITVNPKPTVTITTPAASVCGNSVVAVNVTGNAATYTWTSSVANTLFSDATGTTPYVPGTNTTIVYVKTASTDTITATGASALTCTDTSSVIFSVITKTYSGGIWNPAGMPPATGGTDNLVFNSAWTAGSLSGCSCTVNAGASVFSAGQTLTLTNGLTIAGGSLTFESGASLLQTNNVANTGNVTYKRDTTPVYKFDYTYWSTPVSPQTLYSLSPLSPLPYQYDASASAWTGVNSGSTMTPAKGYILRPPMNWTAVGPPDTPYVHTVSFIGVPNNGTYTIPVLGGSNQLNLFGNPYPSAVDATLFVNDAVNTSYIDGTLYFWTHNTPINATYQYTGSDYAVWNVLGGLNTHPATNPGINTNTPNGFISAGQGFFVKGLANGNATFKNSMRVANGSGANGTNIQFFRSNNPITSSAPDIERHRLWLDISNTEGAYKQMLVGYVAGATMDLDRSFDGEMIDIGNVITFYTMVADKKLSIQGRALPFDVNETIPLGYKSTINGTYTIALSNFDGLFTSQNVYLEDTVTGEIHDLKASNYSFATTNGTFEDRFVLRFNNTSLGVPVFNSNSVIVYNNDLGLHITTGNVLMRNVKIYDVAGRLIVSRNNISASETLFTNLPTTQQVLLVQITSENGEKVTKKVVF